MSFKNGKKTIIPGFLNFDLACYKIFEPLLNKTNITNDKYYICEECPICFYDLMNLS